MGPGSEDWEGSGRRMKWKREWFVEYIGVCIAITSIEGSRSIRKAWGILLRSAMKVAKVRALPRPARPTRDPLQKVA